MTRNIRFFSTALLRVVVTKKKAKNPNQIAGHTFLWKTVKLEEILVTDTPRCSLAIA